MFDRSKYNIVEGGMTTKGYIVVLIICMGIAGMIGYALRDVPLYRAMAWGFEEKEQVWNRIRVDAQGYVMCHKE